LKKKHTSPGSSHFPFWFFVLVVSTFFFIAQEQKTDESKTGKNTLTDASDKSQRLASIATAKQKSQTSQDKNSLIIPFSPIINTAPVNDMLVDSSGTLWVATEKGVYSYANGMLRQFTQDKGTFIAPQAECLAFDGQKVWIGTLFGLFSISKSGRLQRHKISDNPGDEIIWDLEYDGITIWAGTQTGAIFINKQGEFVKINKKISNGGLRHDWCHKICRFSGWFAAAHDQGISFWNTGFKASDPSFWRNVDASRAGITRPVTGITTDGKNLWLSTANGVLYLSTQTDKLFSGSISNFIKYTSVHGLPSNRINAIISHKNAVWAGTDQGLARIKEEQIQIVTPTDARSSAKIKSVCASGDILWLGTDAGIQFINTAMVD
jgi:ligand-binding sensor domain-containing protein